VLQLDRVGVPVKREAKKIVVLGRERISLKPKEVAGDSVERLKAL